MDKARAKRAAMIAQRAIEALGGTDEAYAWLTSPCAQLGGEAPSEVRYDAAGARRVVGALHRARRR